jgi:hypothetical protein
MWLQTLPTTWEKMLASPFDRRLGYLSGEAPAFMSLVQPSLIDKQGLESMAQDATLHGMLNIGIILRVDRQQ